MENSVEIASTAFVDPTAILGAGCKILPFSFIDAGVVIGSGSIIGPGAVLLKGARVGDNCILAGESVIGSNGFGYVFDGKIHQRIPQVGGVTIGSNCLIGPGTCIDRATIDTTIIGANSEIGSLCQIAHNCRLGQSVRLGWGCGLAGSTELGDKVSFGSQVGTAGHSIYGEGVRAENLTGFTKTKISEHTHWAGYPAQEIR